MTVAIPTFNGSKYLRDALESAARQTYEHIEILIVDDGSEDESLEIAEAFGRQHPELTLRVVRNPQRLGLAGNWNRCVELARGEYIKFLFQDDLLEPECVAELVGTIHGEPMATMSFAVRSIRIEGPGDAGTRRWIRRNGILHRRFTRLQQVNRGSRLFREQIAGDPFRNWIGEPTAVLVRTEAIRQAGGFNSRLKQLVDAEMWLRLMCRGDVGFVDKPLATFRLHAESATSSHASDGSAWLDPLWMADMLIFRGMIPAKSHASLRLRARALIRVVRGEVVRVLRGKPPAIISRAGELGRYLRPRSPDARA